MEDIVNTLLGEINKFTDDTKCLSDMASVLKECFEIEDFEKLSEIVGEHDHIDLNDDDEKLNITELKYKEIEKDDNKISHKNSRYSRADFCSTKSFDEATYNIHNAQTSTPKDDRKLRRQKDSITSNFMNAPKISDDGNSYEPKYTYYDKERFCDRRVTKIVWSMSDPQLFAASYKVKKGTSFIFPDGLVAIWDSAEFSSLNTNPLKILEFNNSITALSFVPDDPMLIVGGSIIGHVLVWDIRSSARVPVLSFHDPESPLDKSEVLHIKVNNSVRDVEAMYSNVKVCGIDFSKYTDNTRVIFDESGYIDAHSICGSISESINKYYAFGTMNGSIFIGQPSVENERKVTKVIDVDFPISSINFQKPRGENPALPIFQVTSLDGSFRVFNANSKCQFFIDNKFKYPMTDCLWCPSHFSVYCVADISGDVHFSNMLNPTPLYGSYKNRKTKIPTALGWSLDGITLAIGQSNGLIETISVPRKYINPSINDYENLALMLEKEIMESTPSNATVGEINFAQYSTNRDTLGLGESKLSISTSTITSSLRAQN